MNSGDLVNHSWWLASRASGIVALALLTASVIVGLLLGARAASRVPANLKPTLRAQPRLLTRAHEQLSVVAIVATLLHGVTLLGDSWLKPSLSDIFVPFAMEYRPVFTGIGIVGAYLVAVLGLSYYFRNRIGVSRWKRIHRFAIVGWAFAVVHTLGAGTDAAEGWLFWPVLASCIVVAGLFVARIMEVFTIKRSAPAAG